MDGVTLLREARAAGLSVAAEGDKLVIRGPRRAEPVARLLLAHKPDVLAALAADWRARHREALAHHAALHPPVEAARLAWGELECRWHRLHGVRVPPEQCAGCGKPIAGSSPGTGLAALDLADGNRVHLDEVHGLDCLLAFGTRWRGDATNGLRALGLDPPPGDDEAP
jgi:hypothetical protein